MRIIAGSLKGRKLELPPDVSLRPTKDRVREAVFSVLGSMLEFESAVACDLYAGSGAYGLEALSRGARGAVFCETDKGLCARLEALRVSWGITLPVQIIRGRVESSLAQIQQALQRLGAGKRIIFVDPPYAEDPGATLLPELIKAGIVIVGSVVVMESASKKSAKSLSESTVELPLSLVEQKCKKYGDTVVTFYSF